MSAKESKTPKTPKAAPATPATPLPTDDRLQEAAKDLNTLGLDPVIDVKLEGAPLARLIQDAAECVLPDDELREDTREVLKELGTPVKAQPQKGKTPKAAPAAKTPKDVPTTRPACAARALKALDGQEVTMAVVLAKVAEVVKWDSEGLSENPKEDEACLRYAVKVLAELGMVTKVGANLKVSIAH